METQLQIRHIGYHDDKPTFVVVRGNDMKFSSEVNLTPPDQTPIPGRPNSNLHQDLRWYLEQFLELPLGAYLDTADRVQAALQAWGSACFNTLFQKQARDWFQNARQQGLGKLTLKVASNDPRVLAWPWEALHNPEGGMLAHHCQIERQLSELHDPLPLSPSLPQDCINILLVIARPYGDNDVGFHTLSRPLVELAKGQNSPVNIDVLRPPTFDQLRQTLHDKPGFYHVVHFDGHGGYGTPGHTSPHAFAGVQGMLVFENDNAEPAKVKANTLSQLMAEHRIPIMVLNACQSAKIDEQADDAFASVAAALLKAGIRSVVAMGYNLYVSGAQQFVPAFYQRLLDSGNVAEATRAGRQAMLAHPSRVCALGEHELQDWLVPVLYQQMPTGESVLPQIQKNNISLVFPEQTETEASLPKALQDLGDYGFIGRGRAIHILERARLQQPQSAFLIHGMTGIGKTSLVKGFLHWLHDTNGLTPSLHNNGVFWFSFDKIRSAEHIINEIISSLFGTNALATPLLQKLEALTKAFREKPFLMVWDNFESASGITGTDAIALLLEDDRKQLKELLKRLRGGKTKVLITSRSPENWLTHQECYRIPLSGLQGEELWEYCNAVVRDLGLQVDRSNQDLLHILEELEGNPLAIRMILVQLSTTEPASLLAELKQRLHELGKDGPKQKSSQVLKLFGEGLSNEHSQVFSLICLHERVVGKSHIQLMLEEMGEKVGISKLDEIFDLLVMAGLLQDKTEEQLVYKIHPMFGSFLKEAYSYDEAMLSSFIKIISSFAHQLFLSSQANRKNLILLFSENFFKVINLCESHDKLPSYFALITQGLAWVYSEEFQNYQVSYWLLDKLIQHHSERNEDEALSCTYHAAGNTAFLQQNDELARSYYKKSLLIDETSGDKQHEMLNLYAIGNIEWRVKDWVSSKDFYKRSLTIAKANDDHNLIAMSLHQLGMLKEEQHEYDEALKLYEESYEIKKQHGTEFDLLSSYFQFGRVKLFIDQYELALQWFEKALVLAEKYQRIDTASLIFHNLGMIEENKGNFIEAEQFYKKSLNIKEDILDYHGIASTSGRLGGMCSFLEDFESAALWFIKTMDNYCLCGDKGAALFSLDEYKKTIALLDDVRKSRIEEAFNNAQLEQRLNDNL